MNTYAHKGMMRDHALSRRLVIVLFANTCHTQHMFGFGRGGKHNCMTACKRVEKVILPEG